MPVMDKSNFHENVTFAKIKNVDYFHPMMTMEYSQFDDSKCFEINLNVSNYNKRTFLFQVT